MRIATVLAAALLGTTCLAQSNHARAATQHYQLNIPRQSLDAALKDFAQQTGLQVGRFSGRVDGSAMVGPVSGEQTPEQALEMLLRNTGLDYKLVSDTTIAVYNAKAANASEADEREKGPVTSSAPGAASAQSGAPTGSEPATLEEIVVTAQKRVQLLKDVPAAVTAVTSRDLQALNATKLDDYVARIPGLVVSQVGGANAGTQLTIRGITTGAGGNPTVGVYIDESPFGASSGFGGYTVPDLDPQDLARVEVLRGPQGTLYGAGSLGGLLKYVTARPDPSDFFGRVQIDGSAVDGGGAGYGVRAAANIPLAEGLALRVSGYDRRDPGYVDNVLLDAKDVNDTRFEGGRIALGWQVNSAWNVRLSGLYQNYSGSAPVVDYGSMTFQPTFGDLAQSRARGTTNVEQSVGAYSLLVEGDLGFATLTSASTYDHHQMHFNLDFSTLLSPVFAPLFGIPALGFNLTTPVTINKYTQELRLASPDTDRVSWLLGTFYTHETQDTFGEIQSIDKFTGAFISGLPQFGTVAGPYSFEEAALFGDVTYHLSSAFDITAGLRYSRNEQRNETINQGLVFGNSTLNARSRDDALTFLLSPSFHIDKNTMIYVRVASGYRPGGPNAAAVGNPQTYEPDTVTDYELGLKSDLFERTVSLELSGFYINWHDIQIQRVNSLGSYIDNGSAAVSRGFEASAAWHPLSAFDLYTNVAFTDAHLTQDLPAGSALGLSGDRLPLTPRWSGAAGATYTVPLFNAWKGNLGADWRYVGARPGAFPNAGPRFQHPSYDVLDLRVGITDERWMFGLFAKNIGDDRGQTSDVNLGVGFTSVSVIQPRTFGASLSVQF